MIYYAGIGSRETPPEILDLFTRTAEYFAKRGYILRSGAAKGADSAFEKGCDNLKGNKEIYLPWKGFESSTSNLYDIKQETYEIAKRYHPNWNALKQGGQKLQARNVYQVLGYNLDKPSDFVICWTKGGSGSGGTGQAIRIAMDYEVPVFDYGKSDSRDKLKVFLKELEERKCINK